MPIKLIAAFSRRSVFFFYRVRTPLLSSFENLTTKSMNTTITNVAVHPSKESKYIRSFTVSFEQNGKNRKWDLLRVHDSVAVLIHNTTRDVFVFVTQFRPAVYMEKAKELGLVNHKNGTVNWTKLPASAGVAHELCAGLVDQDRSLEEIAQNEVLEECGYDVPVERLEKITTFRAGVGVSASQHTIFYASVTDSLKTAPGGGAGGELIEVVEVPVKDSLKFAMDDTYERPSGLVLAVLWFHTPGMVKGGQP